MIDTQSNAEDKKSFFKNDRMLVCSMFAFYGICILGLIVATFWWLDQRRQTISTNATSTAFSFATQQAKATGTAIAHNTELAKYEVVDGFDRNANRWLVGPLSNDYWLGKMSIKDGVYLWDVIKVRKSFIYWADYAGGNMIKNFDVYVDFKILESKSSRVCSGLIFKKSGKGWDDGGYAFIVCNSAFYDVAYHGKDDWQDISDWQYSAAIRPIDWNRIEVSAREDHFTLTINNQVVYEMTDERQKEGGIGLFIEVTDLNPTKVSFDNFGFQSR